MTHFTCGQNLTLTVWTISPPSGFIILQDVFAWENSLAVSRNRNQTLAFISLFSPSLMGTLTEPAYAGSSAETAGGRGESMMRLLVRAVPFSRGTQLQLGHGKTNTATTRTKLDLSVQDWKMKCHCEAISRSEFYEFKKESTSPVNSLNRGYRGYSITMTHNTWTHTVNCNLVLKYLRNAQHPFCCTCTVQGYLAHKIHPLLGPYSRHMPRVLGGSQGGERFLLSEVPLYCSPCQLHARGGISAPAAFAAACLPDSRLLYRGISLIRDGIPP